MKDHFSERKITIIGLFIVIGIFYIARLFYIQVVDSQYILSAENNSRRYVIKYPARGLIYDRKGKLLVYNKPAYDVMVVMKEVEPFDTMDFCKSVNIEKDIFIKLINIYTKLSTFNRTKDFSYLIIVNAMQYRNTLLSERNHQ